MLKVGFVENYGLTLKPIIFLRITLIIITLIAISGTLVDVYVNGNQRNQIPMKFLLCFSIYTNGKKLISAKKVEGNIDCLNGIRFFSMAWVVLGHSFYVVGLTPWTNPFETLNVR